MNEVRHVFPAKIDPDPRTAFTALGWMVGAPPDLTAPLGYPTHLVPVTAGIQTQPLCLSDVEAVAVDSWRLTQLLAAHAAVDAGSSQRVVRGGAVPDPGRLGTEALTHWGGAAFRTDAARDLTQATLPAGLPALRALWTAVAETAATLPGGESLAARAWTVLGHPPASAAPAREDQGRLPRSARALLVRLETLRRQATALPSGHVRMPDLYELWAQASLLRALGATDGRFVSDEQGRYTGTFRGPGSRSPSIPGLGFRGVGQGVQQLMPDLLAVFDAGPALVADVKYRPVDRLATEQIREVNRQLLGYMGLTHAQTGVVVWPAPAGEPFREDPLPGGRARLLRLRCHPLDPPGALLARLRHLDLPGVA